LFFQAKVKQLITKIKGAKLRLDNYESVQQKLKKFVTKNEKDR